MSAQVGSLLEHLRPELAELGWVPDRVHELESEEPALEDSTVKIVIDGDGGHPEAVLHCAPRAAPGIVGRGVALARESVRMLGERVGSVVLLPALHGEFEGLTYSVTAWQLPLADSGWRWRFQRTRLAARVLPWLGAVVGVSQRSLPEKELDVRVRAPLDRLAADDRVARRVRGAAARATARLVAGDWTPKVVMVHGDLWKGNILLPRSHGSDYGFYLIDWAGAQSAGFPLWDLMRVCASLAVPRPWVRHAVRRHCQMLGCSTLDAFSCLAAAIADLGDRLEHMPVSSYADAAALTHDSLVAALGPLPDDVEA